MNQYKLIAFDMDGTLLNSQKKIRKETLQAVDRASSAGKEVVLCTGRCIAELREYLRKLPGVRYIVGVSGALVYDVRKDREIYTVGIPAKQVRHIFETIQNIDAMPHIMNHESFVSESDFCNMEHFDMKAYIPLFENAATKVENLYDYYCQHEMPVAKFNIYHATGEGRDRTKKKLADTGFELINAERTSVEISAQGTTKGTGLEKLCGHLNIGMDEAIAVGDADNDIDVLEKAGLAIAMGNANEKVKSVCDVVVSDCDSNGCVEAIEKYLLKE